jgi:hypothetical protein
LKKVKEICKERRNFTITYFKEDSLSNVEVKLTMKYLRFFCDILSKKYIVNYGN